MFFVIFCIGGQTGDKNFGTICKENTNTISFLKIHGYVGSKISLSLSVPCVFACYFLLVPLFYLCPQGR